MWCDDEVMAKPDEEIVVINQHQTQTHIIERKLETIGDRNDKKR